MKVAKKNGVWSLDVELLENVRQFAEQHHYKQNVVVDFALREFFARKEEEEKQSV
jgi:hypothetical protein